MEDKSFWSRVRKFWLKEWESDESQDVTPGILNAFTGEQKIIPKKQKIIHNYFTHRQVIGILGWSLPLVLLIPWVIGVEELRSSISSYYHSDMRDYLVGALCIASFFLIIYNGSKRIDYWITTATGFCGVFAALFPCLDINCTSNPCSCPPEGIFQFFSSCTAARIHYLSAVSFFLLLAINSIYIFPRRDEDSKPEEDQETFGWDIKDHRNYIYKGCGKAIFVLLIAIGIVEFYCSIKKTDSGIIDFVGETLMLFAFGISWSVKGKALKSIWKISRKIKGKFSASNRLSKLEPST